VAVTTTPLGFKKPDGNEPVRGGDNIIADNAQKAEDLIGALWRRTPEEAAIASSEAARLEAARDPEAMFTGAITRDADGAPAAASVVWPDGIGGDYTGTASTLAPGSVDAYVVTYAGTEGTVTYTQPTVTRDGVTGQVVNRPPIEVS